jgi:hypothetical protein
MTTDKQVMWRFEGMCTVGSNTMNPIEMELREASLGSTTIAYFVNAHDRLLLRCWSCFGTGKMTIWRCAHCYGTGCIGAPTTVEEAEAQVRRVEDAVTPQPDDAVTRWKEDHPMLTTVLAALRGAVPPGEDGVIHAQLTRLVDDAVDAALTPGATHRVIGLLSVALQQEHDDAVARCGAVVPQEPAWRYPAAALRRHDAVLADTLATVRAAQAPGTRPAYPLRLLALARRAAGPGLTFEEIGYARDLLRQYREGRS